MAATSHPNTMQTSTGIWHVTYNAENRAAKFESTDGNTIIDCAYDYMGRRFEKKATTNGTVAADGDVNQSIQWSSEMYDTELGWVYYNYRYYNPTDG